MFDTYSAPVWLMAATVLLVAYFVRGLAGFGSGLIAIPLLALSMPLTLVVPLVVFLDYLASASHGLSDRAQIRWREILPLLPFTAVGVALGLYLFQAVDTVMLAHALGIFIIGYAAYTLFFKDSDRPVSRRWSAPAGFLGGLTGTLFGTGGPFYVLYLKHRALPKSEFRATFATIFLIDGAGRLGGYLSGGFFDREWLQLAMFAVPLMAVGLFVGGRVHTTIDQRTFQVAVGALLIVSGASLLLRH